MQHQRQGRLDLVSILLLVAFAVLGTPALSQTEVFKERQEKAELFAHDLLEKSSVKQTIRLLKKVGKEKTEVRDLYYTTVLRVAEEYLETSPRGPRAGVARRLLCGHDACMPAAHFIAGEFPSEQLGEEPRVVGAEVMKPRRLSNPSPQYTEIARKARIQGMVVLKAIIDRQGYVQVYEVVKGLPLGMTESTIRAMEATKFSPALLDGEPVVVYYNLTSNFNLDVD